MADTTHGDDGDSDWDEAREVLQEQRGGDKLGRLKQRVARETIQVEVLGEILECHKPGFRSNLDLVRKAQRMQDILDEDADEAAIDEAEELADEIAAKAAEITVDPSITEESLGQDDHGLEVAMRILRNVGQAVQADVEEAQSFR